MSETRLDKLRTEMESRRLDGLLLSDLTNVRYLTGFAGTAGLVLLTRKDAHFFTDFRYETQAARQVRGARVHLSKNGVAPAAATAANRRRLKRVGYESDHVTVHNHKELKSRFRASLHATQGLVEGLRIRKDEGEIAALEKAVALADEACARAADLLRPGLTEIEVCLELERHMRLNGAQKASFDIIVASGKRSALPHGVASHKKLEQGDLVVLDFGCVYEGYCSDLTRTFCLGDPTPRQQRVYATVRDAQLSALEGLREGLTCKRADRLARAHIEGKRFGKRFGHGLGHGVGMAIHEAPRLSAKSRETLGVGMVVTVEPGIYLPGWGGVRIEDMVVITATGCRILTQSAKPTCLPSL
jgi:Xaa-Pro aminopeptidase